METSLEIKRKNIDLPVDTLQKLSVLAASAGKSLKKYIESVLISKADSVVVTITENPSPSGDSWYIDAGNLAEVNEGIEQYRAGRVKSLSSEEIRKMLEQ
ncbi:MAG: hypothetical protein K2K93_10445 [Muribaculaceae bacterium]|nr:hypothetical protein [Muribaculaceae bacterium]